MQHFFEIWAIFSIKIDVKFLVYSPLSEPSCSYNKMSNKVSFEKLNRKIRILYISFSLYLIHSFEIKTSSQPTEQLYQFAMERKMSRMQEQKQLHRPVYTEHTTLPVPELFWGNQ